MSFAGEAISLGLDAGEAAAEQGGPNLSALKLQLQAFGIYATGVEAAFDENPEYAVTGAVLGAIVAIGVGVALAPEIAATVAAAGLTGTAAIAVETVAGAVASWGVSGSVEDVFGLLGQALSAGDVALPASNMGTNFNIDPSELGTGANFLTFSDSSGGSVGIQWNFPIMPQQPSSGLTIFSGGSSYALRGCLKIA
jgi:hypothetical protein